MSLIFKRGERRAMPNWFAFAGGPNQAVTPETATGLPSVYAAIRHIVDFGSTLPIDAYRRDGENRHKMNSLPRLVAGLDAPGRPGTVSWVGQALYGIATIGNAVGWITETDGFAFPTAVSWLRRHDWSYDEQRRQWYVYGHPVASSQILHIPWLVPPGCTLGLSPLEIFIATIKAGMSAQDYSDISRGGGVPPSILKNVERTLVTEEAEAVRSRAVASFRRGEPFVTGKDWDLTHVTIPPNQSSFIATLKLTAGQIAAIYGLDPVEVGGEAPNSLTYSTEELRQINRAANIAPYVERIEAAVSRVLPERQFIKFNMDAKIRADLKSQTEVIGLQLADGRLSVNEARALKDLPPVPGGDRHNIAAPNTDPVARQGDTP